MGKANGLISDESSHRASSASNNPYLMSKRLWNDMYGDIQDKLQNAYRLIAILSVVIVVLVTSLVIVALKSHVQPYVALLRHDELVTVKAFPVDSNKSLHSKIALSLIKQIIHCARTISTDKLVNRSNTIFVYSFVGSQAMASIKNFHKLKKSDEKNATKHIHIDTVIFKTPTTIDIRWTETLCRSSSCEHKMTQRFTADVTYQITTPSRDPIISKHNPFGFYITDITWAKDII